MTTIFVGIIFVFLLLRFDEAHGITPSDGDDEVGCAPTTKAGQQCIYIITIKKIGWHMRRKGLP